MENLILKVKEVGEGKLKRHTWWFVACWWNKINNKLVIKCFRSWSLRNREINKTKMSKSYLIYVCIFASFAIEQKKV